ncbi:leukocyte elastase inhibitor A [Trichonephila inaurata madagascariensis]|uniref:Leukocyte elastase inhibitor A n=1 Tax=Trichonephila inaurata madagascariensis TaxID=2747483 RepID=A0A8X6Y636_9ARAC|nr:leukocyte elastase inhibitor A [Trichonephila inaurata madagascariensis]
MNAEQSTRYINLFFERNTEGRVPHILSQVPSPSTNLLLLNAIHFRGTLDMNMAQVEESRFVGRAGQDPFIMLEARKARVSYHHSTLLIPSGRSVKSILFPKSRNSRNDGNYGNVWHESDLRHCPSHCTMLELK